jgi:hypothetical protein
MEVFMGRKLKNIKVQYISLVKKGANGKTVILKTSDAAAAPTFDRTIVMKSLNGVLYGIVYSPSEVDSQGDFAEASEIQKAAYGFMKNLHALNVDAGHDGVKRNAYVAESWLVRKGDEIFGTEKPGAWAVGIKLEDNDLIQSIEKGEIAGISMAGIAEAEDQGIPQQNQQNDVIKAFTEAMINISKKLTEPAPGTQQKTDLTATFETAFQPLTDAITTIKKELDLMKTASRQDAAPGKPADTYGIV